MSCDRALDTLIPDGANQPYGMSGGIAAVLDDEEFLEVQPLFAPNIVVGFARVEGRWSASSPTSRSDGRHANIAAGEKASRFVRFCDAFSIPILTLVDVPGYLPGTEQEWTGVIRRGAKLLYAYAEATVPLITIISARLRRRVRRDGVQAPGADLNLAWPTAQIAVMARRVRSTSSTAPEAQERRRPEATRAELITAYDDTLANPYVAAEQGYVDGVIPPHETASRRSSGRCGCCRTKREILPAKKHGNIPL